MARFFLQFPEDWNKRNPQAGESKSNCIDIEDLRHGYGVDKKRIYRAHSFYL
jgi:hypothetical protein